MSMKSLTEKFINSPETGNNRFILQPIFCNRNLQLIRKGKKSCFLPEDFGFVKKSTLTVNICSEGPKFISYDRFEETWGFMLEGAFLILKKSLREIFCSRGKYPTAIINKAAPKWNMEKICKLFNPKLMGSKRFRKILHYDKEVVNNITSWQKAFADISISKQDILKAHEFPSTITLDPQYH